MHYYVYEHWRPDIDACFYVGKGHKGRAWSGRRNPYHKNIVKTLKNLGMCFEVRLVYNGLAEDEALRLEAERIAFWKDLGIKLANLTAGGDANPMDSPEARAKHLAFVKKQGPKNRELLKGKPRPQEVIDRIRATKNSPENLDRARAQLQQRWSDHEYRSARLLEAEKRKGKPLTQETKAKLSASKIGHEGACKGQKRSAEFCARVSAGKIAGWARRRNLINDPA